MTHWISKVPFAFAFVAVVLIAPNLLCRSASACNGYDDLLVTAIEQCPRAKELMGDDVGPSLIGISCGATETSGGQGTAGWGAPYSGSRNRGRLHYTATRDGGDWNLRRAHLEVDDETIDLLRCARTAEAL